MNARSGGTGQPYVNQDILNDVEFFLPPVQEQQSIMQRIEAAFTWLDRMAAEHANASRLLPKLDQAILTRAFLGELVPQDPNDKPVELRVPVDGDGRRGRPTRQSGRGSSVSG
jgi:type I restriction enzyme S subunit